jgi:hypothetical protein
MQSSILSERSGTGVPGDSFLSLGWGVEGPASCNFVKWVGNHEFNPTGTVMMLQGRGSVADTTPERQK